MEYLVKNSPGLIRLLPNEEELGEGHEEEIGGYGDWLAMDGSESRRGLTPKSLIGTAFLAYDAALMAQIADALGKIEDVEKFRQLFQSTKKAFQNEFFSHKIHETEITQTSCILALHFDLVTEDKRVELQQALIKDIESRDVHISTGFVGTPYILYVLANADRLDMAYRLLLQKTYPSWLYPVLHGATTIWERWDGWTKDGGFQDPTMNSFNHYAYGAVGAWMYETILGIKPDPAYPGFKHFILCPQISRNLEYAQGEFNSPYGLIKSSWKLEEDALFWEVIVPPNTSATAYVPTTGDDHILEGNIPVEDAQGVTFIKHLDNASLYELAPGLYRFEVR
jgi:alpha-L-rhamnosidase